MSPRWLVCLVLGLASPAVHAQTAPVPTPGSELAGDVNSDEELGPTAPSAPPPLPKETPTARPFSDAVWTLGHWYWDDGQWRFKPGAWIAKLPGYQFVNGYWRQDGAVWRWVSGGWAKPGSTEVEIPFELTSEELTTAQAPPQPKVETPPPVPAPNLTWAPGYWYWSGTQWAWIGGSWVAPPRPGLVFVSPRWVKRGSLWVFVVGGWAVRGSVRLVIPEYRHASIVVRWGHPHYFFHAWRRYPVVHQHHHRGWSAPVRHHGPQERRRDGRHHR